MKILIGLIIMVVVLFGWVGGTYNLLTQQRVSCDTAWSQVETQYQRRFDLIPNLVEATKGYIIHERAVFDDIAQARTHYAGAVGDDKIKAQGTLDSALARLMVIVENYPNLKANETVHDLMFELAGTENRVNVARQRYNEAIQIYNTSTQIFPSVFIARHFNFIQKSLYESIKGAEQSPKISLEVK